MSTYKTNLNNVSGNINVKAKISQPVSRSEDIQYIRAQVDALEGKVDGFWADVQAKLQEIIELIGGSEDVADVEQKLSTLQEEVQDYIAEKSEEITTAIETLNESIDSLEELVTTQHNAVFPKIKKIEKAFATITVKFDYPAPFSGLLATPEDIVVPYKEGDITINVPSNIVPLAGNLAFYGWTTNRKKAEKCIAEDYVGNIPSNIYISAEDYTKINPQTETTYFNTYTIHGGDYNYEEENIIVLYAVVMKEYHISFLSPLNHANYGDIVGGIGTETYFDEEFNRTVTLHPESINPVYRSLYSKMKVYRNVMYDSIYYSYANRPAKWTGFIMGAPIVAIPEFIEDCKNYPGLFFHKYDEIANKEDWSLVGFSFNNGEYILTEQNAAIDAYGLTGNAELVAWWYNSKLDVYTEDPREYNPVVETPTPTDSNDKDEDEEDYYDEDYDDEEDINSTPTPTTTPTYGPPDEPED